MIMKDELKSMFPNMNLETGIHFGCISQNTLDPDALMGLIDNSADVLYDSASDEFAEDLKTAMEEGTVLELLKRNYMDESYVDEDYDTIVSEWCQGYQNDYHQWYYQDEEYEMDFSEDMNCIIILRSPYYTYCRGCSPCVPNAGDLDSPVTPEDYLNDKNSSIYTTLKKAYCLPDEFFEDDTAPYQYFGV
jgi:hypothetical protein